MIESEGIEKRLKSLERLYLQAMSSSEAGSELPALYGKMAVIELGGWVEEARDALADKLVDNIFLPSEKVSREKLLGRVSGFEYKQHFCRDIFQKLLGLHGVSELEERLEGTIHDAFKSNLGSLWLQRNTCAHRTLAGTMEQIQGPSATIAQMRRINAGLQELGDAIDKLSRVQCPYRCMR